LDGKDGIAGPQPAMTSVENGMAAENLTAEALA
jgi:hypothetical protein